MINRKFVQVRLCWVFICGILFITKLIHFEFNKKIKIWVDFINRLRLDVYLLSITNRQLFAKESMERSFFFCFLALGIPRGFDVFLSDFLEVFSEPFEGVAGVIVVDHALDVSGVVVEVAKPSCHIVSMHVM